MKKKLAYGTGDVFDISRALVGVVVPVVPVVPSPFRRSVVISSFHHSVVGPSFRRSVVVVVVDRNSS